MAASAIVNNVYQEHVKFYGKPDESFVYENRNAPEGFPRRVDVFVWYADADCDMTTLSTIGMSDLPMPGCQHRAELHFSIRQKLSSEEAANVSLFMANLAMHPFHSNSYFDWWHSIAKPGAIPLFTKAQSVWLYPAFVEDGWDKVDVDGEEARILNIVPITADELVVEDIIERAELINRVDIFTPR